MTEIATDEGPKYVVFKLDEYESGSAGPLPDAVVIRLKDPFAATALFTYANTIMSFLELMDGIEPDEYQRMLDIADYFHQQACASQDIKGKRLPD